MNILDFFERAYIINLPERSDRRQAITQNLKTVRMPLTPGKLEIFPAIRPTEANGFPGIGARGCFMSHLQILKMARQEGLSNVLIMEDDLLIKKQLQADQNSLIEQLRQADWGFAYFGHNKNIPSTSSTAQFLPFSEEILTAHFYGVNGKFFDRLIHFLEMLQHRPPGHPEGGPMHLDGAYNAFRAQNPDIVALISIPNLGIQRSSRSDISPAWFDVVPVVSQLVNLARIARSAVKAY
ncbi:glycosyltransferase family 25 protein [Leptodesmis sp.]|uniref:glycosyltransferase family 25 protein n=1 Tax=Leptodesmis sp. TaxID=3100501 RepID=UPI0040535914